MTETLTQNEPLSKPKTTKVRKAAVRARRTSFEKKIGRKLSGIKRDVKGATTKANGKVHGLPIEKPRAADPMKYLKRAARESIYGPVVEAINKLKLGQELPIPVPKGTDPRVIHNRLNAALTRVKLTPPKGCRFCRHTTTDNRVVISCVKK